MHNLRQDLVYGLRMMHKNPGITLIMVVTMALGIGINTAVFGIVNSMLLRPLPYADASQLVELSERTTQAGDLTIVYPNFLDWQRQNTVFSGMSAFLVFHFNLHAQDSTERIPVGLVSSDFFGLLRVEPTQGRSFRVDDDRVGAAPVVIVTDAFWKEHLGADPDFLSKTITLDDQVYSIVGLLPPQFRFYQPADVLIPYGLMTERYGMMDRANHKGTWAIARLKPGVSVGAARAQMDTIALRLEQHFPNTNTGSRVNVIPLRDRLTRQSRPAALLLLGAVALVLLIACVNLANLMLARAEKRQREMAIRLSLGATRTRIIRQLLLESFLLAFTGGTLGLLCGLWSFEVLKPLLPWGVTQLQPDANQLDFRMLGFTIAITLLAGSLFGLAPALEASRPDLQQVLRSSHVELRTRIGRFRVSHLLVMAQVALALMLLCGAGLLLHSFQ
jgi:putative ABC transport system permease protein